MRYKFTNFVDALQIALDAWYFSTYEEKRNGKKVDNETMARFLRDVDGWSNMFFSADTERAMDDINYETLEVTHDEA